MPTEDRTLAAAGLILIYALVIGFTDNFVRVIAAEAGLWQFHATRSAMALVLLVVLAVPLGLRLRPVRPAGGGRAQRHPWVCHAHLFRLARIPAGRSSSGGAVHRADLRAADLALRLWPSRLVRFGLLRWRWGFWVCCWCWGQVPREAPRPRPCCRSCPGRCMLWAISRRGNGAGRKVPRRCWRGFFAALGVLGVIGLGVLWLMPLGAAEGAAGFIQRGLGLADGRSSCSGPSCRRRDRCLRVGMMIKAYQMAEASRVSVFEYMHPARLGPLGMGAGARC